MKDWVEWHRDYDDPTSRLSQRLAVVHRFLSRAIDRLDAGPRGLLSLCAGEGRDVIPVLAAHRRRADVRAVLVEAHPALADAARQRAAEAGLDVDVRVGDAGDLATFADVVPVDLLLLCGIFGNISSDDIAGTVHAVPALAAPGASVLWTKGGSDPDRRPWVRQLFAGVGCTEMGYEGAPATYGVGFVAVPPDRGPAGPAPNRLFAFVR